MWWTSERSRHDGSHLGVSICSYSIGWVTPKHMWIVHMLETPTRLPDNICWRPPPLKRKKGKGAGTTRVDSDGCRIVRKRMTCLDSYWSTIIYMTVGTMRILVLIKFKFICKNRKPDTRGLHYQHLIRTGLNICQNMSICVRQPTYVKICSYVAFSQQLFIMNRWSES